MRFDTLFFDLDETLYPSSSGLWRSIRERINTYMQDRMGFSPEQVELLREKYFREYGTTLRGLQANYPVNMEDYLAFVHNVPLEPHLRPDLRLRGIIEALPARKFIFTNADCAHASRVTRVLGLEGLWDKCIDVHILSPYCKPMPESFELALSAAGSPDPHNCALLDDQPRITRAARQLGMFTILVGRQPMDGEADAGLQDWAELPAILEQQI